MQPFTSVTGVGVPLRRANIDTDQIIPAVYLKRVSRTGFEDGLFAAWRAQPDFVLNQPAYQRGVILVAGSDFGIGSSREHAVWALLDYGFRVVIAPRFGDIFRGNAGKAGLVTAVVPQSTVDTLWTALVDQPGLELTVNLEARSIGTGRATYHFEIDDYTAYRLLNGLDDISLTLGHEADIAAFEAARPGYKPTTLPARP